MELQAQRQEMQDIILEGHGQETPYSPVKYRSLSPESPKSSKAFTNLVLRNHKNLKQMDES